MDYYIESTKIKDIYLLPATSPEKTVLYSPLRGIALMADRDIAKCIYMGDTSSEDVKQITKDIEQIEINSNFITESQSSLSENIVFLLSNKCNLNCRYCYAQFNRQDDILSKEVIKTVINYILPMCSNSNKKLDISFLGGGEPTFHWDLLQWAILYIKEQVTHHHLTARIGFPTNGTMLNEKRIQFLSENNIQIGLSFDILPSIQDEQRPFLNSSKGTYDIVCKNIDLLNKYGIQTRFRTTITPEIVSKMEDMVLHTYNRFPYVKKIHFEPTYPLENDISSIYDYDLFYANFIRYFMIAYKRGQSLGIQVNTAATNTLNKTKLRYCKGEFCVTPNGDIVMCHRASSQEDTRFTALHYGTIDSTGVHLNINDYNSVQKKNCDIPQKCKDCFSKWHCAGMCISNRMMFSEKHHDAYCNYVRAIQSIYIENIIMEGGV